MGTEGLKLTNGIGYLWAEQEIHKIAAIYGHGYGADTNQTVTYYYGGPNDRDLNATGEYVLSGVEAQQGRKTTMDLDSGARAVTIEDINKICGYEDKYKVSYSDKTVQKTEAIAAYYPMVATENTSTGISPKQSGISFDGQYYYNTYYEYYINSEAGDTEEQINKKNLVKSDTRYWLASRCIYSTDSSTDFGIRYTGWGGVFNYNACYCSGGEAYVSTPVNAIRAIVTLNYDVKTADIIYNESTGWNLVD